MYSRVTDTIHSGVSERYTLILDGGAGGANKQPGDYLYHNGIARRFRQGAWGIMRVLPKGSTALQALPSYDKPAGTYVQPAVTGLRPPATTTPGQPCPAGATNKSVAISAVDVPNSVQGTPGSNGTSTSVSGSITATYVLTANAATAKLKGVTEPLVVHINAGDCVTVNFTNQRAAARASLSVGELSKSAASSGVNVGFDTEQTVAPGGQRTYKFYAETESIEAAQFSDFGGDATGRIGLYGAFVVHPVGAWFTNPTTGARTATGAIVDAHVPGQPGYRDDTLFLQDTDPQIGSDFMPYPIKVDGLTLVNYKNAGRRTDDFSGTVATPLLQAYVGDADEDPRAFDTWLGAAARLPGGRPQLAPRPVHAGLARGRHDGPVPISRHRCAPDRWCRRTWLANRRLLLRRQPPALHRGRYVGSAASVADPGMRHHDAGPPARRGGLRLERRERKHLPAGESAGR